MDDWRGADLPPADRALCAFAVALTARPHERSSRDLEALRDHGFDDRAIHDAVQVVALFNYYTRIADGLGIEPEEGIGHWGRAGRE